MAQQQFDTSEAEAVLMEAARRQAQSIGGTTAISRERLAAMAAELDIAPETLAEVLAEREIGATDATLRANYIAERRGTIIPHITPYIMVSIMLIVIWAITTPGGHPWFLYPIMGWGIGVASHLAAVFPTSGPGFEAGFENYKKRVERRERDKARRIAKRTEKLTGKPADVTESTPIDTWQPTLDVSTENETITIGRKR